MITLAEAEYIGDRQLINRIKRAEEKYGYRTGVRHSENGKRIVKVKFYPKTTFYIADVDNMYKEISVYKELTQEEYLKTHSLKL